MNIIIIGAGEVGFQIAERLVSENHDVVIIDNDTNKILEINRKLDVLTIIGQGGDYKVLDRAGIRTCDILIAATNVDEINMIACFIARKFEVSLKIARIRSYLFENEGLITKEELGIDVLINPEIVATDDIINLIHSPNAFEIANFSSGLLIKGYRISEDIILANKNLVHISRYPALRKMLLLAIIRNDELIVPKGSDKLLPGDKVYVIAKSQDFKDISPYFYESNKIIQYVFIVGVTWISKLLSEQLIKMGIRIKLIEPDANKCLSFAESNNNVEVVNGTPTDLEMLKDEGIDYIDAFIALSDDEEVNILSSMIAKEQNVKKTIAKIQKNEYLPFTSKMGIDAVINPKLSTVGEILKYVRRGNILSVDTLGEKNAEAIEYLVTIKNNYLNIPLREVKFPPSALIAAIIRNDFAIIPKGEDFFQVNDRVIIFSAPDIAQKMGDYFL